ncbi:MAG: hypothetical protein AABX12_01095 [Nanoarchaeota archaeon]
METETQEPVNEKGLTKADYFSRNRGITRNLLAGILASVAIGTGVILYPSIIEPQMPTGDEYQTYADAQKTLAQLTSVRKKVVSLNDIALTNLPYRTERLDGILGTGGSDFFNESNLVTTLDAARQEIDSDITKMRAANPEFGAYESRLKSESLRGGIYAFGGLGLGMVSCLLSGKFAKRRERKLGSTNFSYDLNGKRITEKQK